MALARLAKPWLFGFGRPLRKDPEAGAGPRGSGEPQGLARPIVALRE